MNRISKRSILLAIGMAITPWLFAQQDSGAKQWTLQECVDYALENNLSVERSLLNVQASDINLDQSKMALLPTLNGSSGTSYNWGRSIDLTTYDFTTQRVNIISSGLNSSVTLFNGFAQRNTVTQSRLTHEANKNNLAKAKNDITQNVILFYMNVIFNKELYENAKLQLASTQEQVTRTQKQADAGAAAKSALLDIEAQLAANEVNVVNQENALNLSKLQLMQLLQIQANESFDVIIPDIELQDNEALNTSVAEIYEQSLITMPEIKSADLGVQSAEYGEKVAKGRLYPRLTASAGISTNYSDRADGPRFVRDGGPDVLVDPNPQIGFVQGTNEPVLSTIALTAPSGEVVNDYPLMDQYQDNLTKFIGLNLSIPIFNGYSARANVQRAMVSKRQAEITKIETNNTLRQSIETALNDVMAAAKSYQSSVKLVEAREEAFRVVQRRNAVNSISKYDYQIAENDLFRAKSDLLRAKYDYIFKLKILDFYQGKTLDF